MAPNPENDKKGNSPVFNEEERKKITSLENLLKARKNLLEDVDRYNPDPEKIDDDEDDNDGLKEYRGIF
jgi:hypothetical protein